MLLKFLLQGLLGPELLASGAPGLFQELLAYFRDPWPVSESLDLLQGHPGLLQVLPRLL